MARPPYRLPYCLYCYAPMELFDGASMPCSLCGRINVKEDQRRLWTLEPWLRKVEGTLKALTVALTSWIASLILLNPGVGWGRGHGMAIGLPILLGVILWDTASAITHKRSGFQTGIVWLVILGIIGGSGVLIGWIATTHGHLTGGLICIALAAPLLLTGLGAPFAGGAWRRWATQRISTGQL